MLIFDTQEVNINILDYSYYDDSSLDANQTTGFDTSKITFSRHRMFRGFDFFGAVAFQRYQVFGDFKKQSMFLLFECIQSVYLSTQVQRARSQGMKMDGLSIGWSRERF